MSLSDISDWYTNNLYLQVVCSGPQSEAVGDFVCRNNIFLFLYAAVNNFGLDPDQYFFDPTALYQYKDISKVIPFILPFNCHFELKPERKLFVYVDINVLFARMHI